MSSFEPVDRTIRLRPVNCRSVELTPFATLEFRTSRISIKKSKTEGRAFSGIGHRGTRRLRMNAKRRKWLNPRPLCREVRRNDREQATVDAYGDSEQITGWLTIIEENLAVPFETTVLGVPVTVERIDLDGSE